MRLSPVLSDYILVFSVTCPRFISITSLSLLSFCYMRVGLNFVPKQYFWSGFTLVLDICSCCALLCILSVIDRFSYPNSKTGFKPILLLTILFYILLRMLLSAGLDYWRRTALGGQGWKGRKKYYHTHNESGEHDLRKH